MAFKKKTNILSKPIWQEKIWNMGAGILSYLRFKIFRNLIPGGRARLFFLKIFSKYCPDLLTDLIRVMSDVAQVSDKQSY